MAPPIRPGTVIGLDVGKPSHWACVVTREGELLASKLVLNRENDIDGLYAQYPGALVVVDQVRNIGSLALSRARLAGMPRAYLPGLAAHGASKLFAGDAKTDERDAMVIAKMALTESVESSSRPRPAAAACLFRSIFWSLRSPIRRRCWPSSPASSTMISRAKSYSI